MTRFNLLSGRMAHIFLFVLFPFLSNAGIVVLNGLTHLHDVVPGETYRGSIEIQNTADHDQPVKLYQRDYSFNFEGEAFYETPGTVQRSNAAWLDISPKFLILKAKEKTTVNYELKVPQNGNLTGTYWSVIMVEGEAPVDANKLHNGMTIQTQLRYAIQIAATVGKTGERNLTFFDVKMMQQDGHKMLAVDIENKGEVLFKPDVSLELFNEQGHSVGTFVAIKKKIYPDTSARFFLDLEGVPSGVYQSLILADCGEEDVFGINLEVRVEDL